ncbi:class I adenylate-forming enzyme family protein [Vibrio splendidus]
MYSNKDTLSQYLDHSAVLYHDKTAIVDERTSLTYQELRSDALNIAHYIHSLDIKKGDRVLLFLPNSIEFVQCFWAIQYLGAVAIPVNPDTKMEKLAWLIDNSESSLLVVDRLGEAVLEQACKFAKCSPHILGCKGHLASPEQVENLTSRHSEIDLGTVSPISADLSTIIYTSGSTGTPKGVMLTQKNMVTASHSVASYLNLDSTDRIFCTIPMSFDYGLHQSVMSALVGATLIIEGSFSQPLFSLHRLVKHQATVFPIVPTMLSLIAPLANRFDFSSLRAITNTAAALHAGAIDQIGQLFPTAQLFSMYGLTECHRCTYLPPEQLLNRKESVGIAIPNTEMWVIDEHGQSQTKDATGELVIRGDTVMMGYWKNQEKTDEKLKPGMYPTERVLYTGDICRLDEDGYLYFIGRKDEILKSYGEKVAPKEVERTIYQIDDVSQVVVLGAPHPVYGDEIIAWVESRSHTVTDNSIKEWCKSKLESYMVPHRVYISERLPRNGNGKIDKAFINKMSQPDYQVEKTQ